MNHFLKVCLWTQIFAFLFATLAFGVLADPRLAGSMTGPVFLLSGALPMAGILVKRISLRQTSFWMSAVFTFFFSGPLLLKRMMYFGSAFSEITFYGMSSQVFHRVSSIAYLILFLSLAFDLYRIRRQPK